MVPEEKTRVNFNAPKTLVNQADIITELLDISRTRLLIEALRDEIEEMARNEQFQHKLKEAYYDGRADFSTIESIMGREEAMRMKLLRESLGRDVPEPQVEGELPSQDEFYSESISEWTPDTEDDDGEARR